MNKPDESEVLSMTEWVLQKGVQFTISPAQWKIGEQWQPVVMASALAPAGKSYITFKPTVYEAMTALVEMLTELGTGEL